MSAVESLCSSLESLWLSDPLVKALNSGMSWGDIPGLIDFKATAPRLPLRPSASEPQCPIHRTLNACEIEAPEEAPESKDSLPCPPPAHRIPFDTHVERRAWFEDDEDEDEDGYDSDEDCVYVSIGEALRWTSAPIIDYEARDKQRASSKYKPDTVVVVRSDEPVGISVHVDVQSSPAPAVSQRLDAPVVIQSSPAGAAGLVPVAPVKPVAAPVAPPVVQSSPAGAAGLVPGIKTLIARNLPRDITVQQLRLAFEKYGPVKDIYIPKNMDRASPYFGTTKGFALIKFLNADHTAKAFTSEYGRLTIGRNNISLEFAKEDR